MRESLPIWEQVANTWDVSKKHPMVLKIRALEAKNVHYKNWADKTKLPEICGCIIRDIKAMPSFKINEKGIAELDFVDLSTVINHRLIVGI